MFSIRSAVAREINAFTAELGRVRAAAGSILDLSESNPTRAGLPYEEARILAALSDPRVLTYEPEPRGLLSAREAIASEWRQRGVNIGEERILLTASTSEAYGLLFKLLCDAGDEVLVPAPSYPLFEHLARFENVRAVPYSLGFDGAWFLDFDRLQAARSERTRAIIVVHPNNPTGHYLRRSQLGHLAAFGLPLISDEVFASYALRRPEGAARSALELEGSVVFALSGLSKLAALPQMKAAWIGIGGPEPAVGEAMARLELIADAYLSVGAPVQIALPELLRASARTAEQIVSRLRRNLAVLESRVKNTEVSVLPVEGGWYAVLRLPRTQSEESWALGLLREQHVLAQPGYFYDFADEPLLVLSLLSREAEFELGVARLVDHVRRHSA